VKKISETSLIPGDAGRLNSEAKKFNCIMQIERVLKLSYQIGVKFHL